MKPFLRLLLPVLVLVLAACQGPGAKGPDIDDNGPDDDPQPLAGVITGTLTDSSGAPLADAEVTLGYAGITVAALEPAAAQWYATNELGQFAFDVGEEGDYTLTWMEGNEGALRRVTVNRDAEGNLTSRPITMQAAELGRVAGRVVTRGAEPWAFLLGTSFHAPADANGDFLIRGVPAGNYELAPGLVGVRGKAVAVTVEAGALTTVDEPLEFGPIITSVSPVGFMFEDAAQADYPEQMHISIKGSGFGTSMGVSQLRYGTVPVNGHVISWSDEEIVLRMSWVSDEHVVNHDDLRFNLSALTGEAHTDRLGVIYGSINEGDCTWDWPTQANWISARVSSFGLPINGAPILFTVENGVVRSEPGAPAGTTFQTNSAGCVRVVVEPDAPSTLLTRVTASYEGIELIHELDFRAPLDLQLDQQEYWYLVSDDTVDVSGRLVHADSGEGVTSSELVIGVTDNYDGVYQYETPMHLNASGHFTVSIPAEHLASGWADMVVLYEGVELTRQYAQFYPANSLAAGLEFDEPVETVDIGEYGRASFIVNVPASVAAAAPALYLELDHQLPLHVEWNGGIYTSESSELFRLNAVSPLSTASLSPMALRDSIACRGSCVILDSEAETALVTVRNPNFYPVSVGLYAFVDMFQDYGEPVNDTRDGAILIDDSNPEDYGALETVNDVDYFLVGGPEGSGVTIHFLSPNFSAAMWVETASGEHKAGPFYDGDAVPAVGGDYLRIEATGPYAAPSAVSEYYLWSIW